MTRQPVRLLTAFHSPFSTPAYVAHRLGRILVAGGLIRHAAPFEILADNTFAGAARA